jgi:hypothetical protein
MCFQYTCAMRRITQTTSVKDGVDGAGAGVHQNPFSTFQQQGRWSRTVWYCRSWRKSAEREGIVQRRSWLSFADKVSPRVGVDRYYMMDRNMSQVRSTMAITSHARPPYMEESNGEYKSPWYRPLDSSVQLVCYIQRRSYPLAFQHHVSFLSSKLLTRSQTNLSPLLSLSS